VFANVLQGRNDGRSLGGHRIGLSLVQRRSRRLELEAAEVAEIDRWLATMRSGPELVLYSAHPGTPVRPGPAAPAGPSRRGRKRRR
jgi:hypothetical protein